MARAVMHDRAIPIDPPPGAKALVQQAREQWLQGLASALPALAERLERFLEQLSTRPCGRADQEDRRAARERFRSRKQAWIQACSAALQNAQTHPPGHRCARARSARPPGDSTIWWNDPLGENRRLASQLALTASELIGGSFEALRLRSQWLLQQPLATDDPLRPEALCQLLVEQWQAAGLPCADLQALTGPLQAALGALLQEHYTAVHQLYDRQRVPPSHDLGTAPIDTAVGPWVPPVHSLQQAHASARQAAEQLLSWLIAPDGTILPGQEALALAAQTLLETLTQGPAQEVPRPPPPGLSANAQPPPDSTSGEHTVLEIVARMFQNILGEERVPPGVRIWLARLQIPVLRVAVAEPVRFCQPQHPARRLIDRLGSCILGFAASGLESSLLEAEIRRLVRLVEQYAETGSRVFQLALQEFEALVVDDLAQQPAGAHPVSIGQQLEQKETLTIQYTIELRCLLKDMPVRDALRDFLFNHWAEVLALSALRHGPMHAQTLAFKQTASDLAWAASAQPTRTQRAQFNRIRSQLLQRLREGLTLMGMHCAMQTQQLEPLLHSLDEPLTVQTASIPPADLERMARRLGQLEDFMAEESPQQDAALSAEYLERLLGVDIANLHVLAGASDMVDAALLETAGSLQPGGWFTLAHQGANIQVQYVWRGMQRQLHLFASLAGTCYLITRQRLAHALQSGLLRWHDAEDPRR